MSVADLALEMLANDEAYLRERVLQLESERDVYRTMTQEALTLVAALTEDLNRLRRQHHHLLEEYRSLRRQAA